MSTVMYMLQEQSPYMMSFVIITERNRCVVVDGGRPEDMPLLKQYVANRPIAAWILTHPHSDHISGFVSEMERNGGADFEIERVIYHFPDYEEMMAATDVPDRAYLEEELNEMLPAFGRVRHLFADREYVAAQGDRFTIDELSFEVLYTAHKGLYANPINDSSMVFRMSAPNKSVLFLGDLGPDGGDVLYFESKDKLSSDIVQMAHHGHMNVSMEVYAAIAPKVCFWSAPLWLYNEPHVPPYLADREKLVRMKRIRMYGSATTRHWMDLLGVREHYVSGLGTQQIEL